MKTWMAVPMVVLALVAVTAVSALAAGSTERTEKYNFTLTGQLVSVTNSRLLIKVAKAPSALVRYEQKGELTVMLAPKAVVKMGKARILAASLKPKEQVYVVGWYTLGPTPTIEATAVTVLAGK